MKTFWEWFAKGIMSIPLWVMPHKNYYASHRVALAGSNVPIESFDFCPSRFNVLAYPDPKNLSNTSTAVAPG